MTNISRHMRDQSNLFYILIFLNLIFSISDSSNFPKISGNVDGSIAYRYRNYKKNLSWKKISGSFLSARWQVADAYCRRSYSVVYFPASNLHYILHLYWRLKVIYRYLCVISSSNFVFMATVGICERSCSMLMFWFCKKCVFTNHRIYEVQEMCKFASCLISTISAYCMFAR